MTRRQLAQASMVLMLLVASCQSRPDDARRAAVEDYVTQLRSWAAAEGEAGRAIERIVATHFVDEAEVLRQIADSRPRVEAHLALIRGYEPKSPDTLALHRFYTHTWEQLLETYDTLAAGLDRADGAAVARARQGLLDWRRGLRQVAEDLRDVAAAVKAEL